MKTFIFSLLLLLASCATTQMPEDVFFITRKYIGTTHSVKKCDTHWTKIQKYHVITDSCVFFVAAKELSVPKNTRCYVKLDYHMYFNGNEKKCAFFTWDGTEEKYRITGKVSGYYTLK